MSDKLRHDPHLEPGLTRPAALQPAAAPMGADALNPYAPPTAVIAERFGDAGDDGAVQPVRLFSVKGRIGRVRLLAYWMYSALLLNIVAGVLGALAGGAGAPAVATIFVFVLLIPYLWFTVCMMAQRSHDMGWSAWTALWTLIPFVAFVWLCAAGTPGRNRFGAPPPPNTFMVKLGAWLLPIFFVLGILAAIAIPAYQGYVKRAQTTQR